MLLHKEAPEINQPAAIIELSLPDVLAENTVESETTSCLKYAAPP